jgi:fructose-1,6-bisphosphatase/sedoheptulose 1,7-bisphosphatase-like protein
MQTTVDPAVEAEYREKGWWGTECLTDVIRRLAATNPQGTAFVDEHGDRMSWRVYDEVSDRIASAHMSTDLARGDVIVAATGVTDGALIKGVHFSKDVITTETVVYRSATGTVRRIYGEHRELSKFHLD